MNGYDIKTRIIVLCSFVNPNMKIIIGDTVYQNVSELRKYVENIKTLQLKKYFAWIEQNFDDIYRYSKCVDTTISHIADRMKNELVQDQKRSEEQVLKRKEKQIFREEQRRREEQARRERMERRCSDGPIIRNPVLNSPNDIIDELIQQIIDNNIDSLTINYEFTGRCCCEKETDIWKYVNPFLIANRKSELKYIDFEIKLGKNVHSLANAFRLMSNLEYVNLKNTASVTDMSYMFYGASSFNQLIDIWDTSNVTNMAGMFEMASSFDQPIGNWNTSKVTDMNSMFKDAESFNQPVDCWILRAFWI